MSTDWSVRVIGNISIDIILFDNYNNSGWFIPSQARFNLMIKYLWSSYPMFGAFEDREAAIKAYELHNDNVCMKISCAFIVIATGCLFELVSSTRDPCGLQKK